MFAHPVGQTRTVIGNPDGYCLSLGVHRDADLGRTGLKGVEHQIGDRPVQLIAVGEDIEVARHRIFDHSGLGLARGDIRADIADQPGEIEIRQFGRLRILVREIQRPAARATTLRVVTVFLII